MKELIAIQSELKVPKNQFNSFGEYKYRSCEDILETVKPILQKQGCVLTLCDDIVNIGAHYYVKATARLLNADGDEVAVTAFAREEESRPKMSNSQLTGAASSYARKYALNGLFCIDDTKDDDTNEARRESAARAQKPSTASATAPARKRITMEQLDDAIVCDQLMKWMYGFLTTANYAADFDAGARLLKSYDADAEVVDRFSALFESYRQARKNAK